MHQKSRHVKDKFLIVSTFQCGVPTATACSFLTNWARWWHAWWQFYCTRPQKQFYLGEQLLTSISSSAFISLFFYSPVQKCIHPAQWLQRTLMNTSLRYFSTKGTKFEDDARSMKQMKFVCALQKDPAPQKKKLYHLYGCYLVVSTINPKPIL